MEVVRASLPFLGCMIIALGLITYIPALTIPGPKERRGRVTEFARQIKVAYQAVSSVQEVTLPDGTLFKLGACSEIGEELGREDCKGLFLEVTKCREAAGGEPGGECEKNAVAAYLERTAGGDDDWDTDDEDDDDGGDGEAEDDTADADDDPADEDEPDGDDTGGE
jgi:hypothetical protein